VGSNNLGWGDTAQRSSYACQWQHNALLAHEARQPQLPKVPPQEHFNHVSSRITQFAGAGWLWTGLLATMDCIQQETIVYTVCPGCKHATAATIITQQTTKPVQILPQCRDTCIACVPWRTTLGGRATTTLPHIMGLFACSCFGAVSKLRAIMNEVDSIGLATADCR
jgi:hypothetical protein